MIRCPRCGIRLRNAASSCKLHTGGHEAPAAGAATATTLVTAPEPTTQEWVQALQLAAPALLAELGYRVEKLLGRGGFGIVYAAERVSDATSAAIKISPREQRGAERNLTVEAAALRRVGPPFVPIVYANGSVREYTYLALELIRAPTLADQLLAQAGPLPRERFAAAAMAILRAVAAIHARGVVHRDLKPENILLDEAQATIIDFALALTQGGSAARDAADASEAIGTAEYMSPEQCEGAIDADPRSDIYSLGVLFYEMLSGAPPFWGSAQDVREAHRSRRPAPLSPKVACSAELDRVIRRCLAKDPSRRFDDVTTLRRALEAAIDARRESRSLSKPAPVDTAAQVPRDPASADKPVREQLSVGLVFFESRAGLGTVQTAIVSAGGQIVQTSGLFYVAAFAHDTGDNPARSALIAAQRLFATKLSQRLVVDVATVSAQIRADGSRRLFSRLFSRQERFPSSDEPEGVMLAQAAAQVISGLRTTSIATRADRFLLDTSNSATEMTRLADQNTEFVGRNRLLEQVLDDAGRAFSAAEPTLFTVTGEPGYGRTHLGSVVALRLERYTPAIDVIRLAAQAGVVGAVSQILPELLRRALGLPMGSAPADPRGVLRERLGSGIGEQVWAAAALALGWIDANHPDLRRLAAAPGALRTAAARAAGEALRQRARDTPLAIVLDDAHLADDATLDALEYATLREAAARVFVCVLVRPSFASARGSWGTRAARARRHVLTPLEHDEAIELARQLLAPVEYAAPLALSRLVERTQGIPQLLVELVRGLKRDGVVRRSQRGTGYYLATDELEKLPDLPIVQWNASREVDALPRQLAGHARLSSVLGSNFTVAEVETLLSILEGRSALEDSQLDAGVGIRRLIEAGLLLRRRNGLIDFRHALLRDTIYQQVPEAQRQKLHRAAFEMYQDFAMADEQRLPRLALHAARSGAKEAAAAAYFAVAERALLAHAYLEAEAAFGGALENLAETDERVVDAARGRGLMRFRLGRHHDAINDLGRARERARSSGNRQREVELLLDEATVLDWTLDLTRSAQLVQEAESIAVDPRALLSAKLRMGRARVHHRRGEAELSAGLAAEAALAAQSLGDSGYETFVIGLLMAAPDCASLGRLDAAQGYFDSVIAEAELHADLHHLSAAYINRALLWFARKDVQRLMEDLTRATQLAREIGEPLLEYGALINMAEVAYAIDELEPATQYAHRALELARQLWGEASRELNTRLLMLARIALYREDLHAAHGLVGQMLSCMSKPGDDSVESSFFPADQALFDMIELSASNAGEPAWAEFTERMREVQMQPHEELEILETQACAAFRNGMRERSRALFEQALRLAAAKPSLLDDRLARSFSKRFQAQDA